MAPTVPWLYEHTTFFDFLEDPLRRLPLRPTTSEHLVSVVIAARDAAPSLERSVASILGQSHRNLELLVVDDGSRDRTRPIALALARSDHRIRVFSSDRSFGAATARNVGLIHARGEYVTFQDSDDSSDSRRLAWQLSTALDRGAVVVTCNYRRVESNGKPVCVNGKRVRKSFIASMFHRKWALDHVGFLRTNLRTGEDSDFFERMSLALGPCSAAHVDRVLYLARFDPSSLLFRNGTLRTISKRNVSFELSQSETSSLEAARRLQRSASEIHVSFTPPSEYHEQEVS